MLLYIWWHLRGIVYSTKKSGIVLKQILFPTESFKGIIWWRTPGIFQSKRCHHFIMTAPDLTSFCRAGRNWYSFYYIHCTPPTLQLRITTYFIPLQNTLNGKNLFLCLSVKTLTPERWQVLEECFKMAKVNWTKCHICQWINPYTNI